MILGAPDHLLEAFNVPRDVRPHYPTSSSANSRMGGQANTL